MGKWPENKYRVDFLPESFLVFSGIERYGLEGKPQLKTMLNVTDTIYTILSVPRSSVFHTLIQL